MILGSQISEQGKKDTFQGALLVSAKINQEMHESKNQIDFFLFYEKRNLRKRHAVIHIKKKQWILDLIDLA